MKRIIPAAFSIFFLLSGIAVSAQQEKNEREKFEFVKEKTISKTYPASGNKLSVNNSFGHVKFIPWDKNEIKVDVYIQASANREDVAQEVFNAISVSDKQQGNEIEFTTKIENNNNNCKNCKSTMHIDYEVHLPASESPGSCPHEPELVTMNRFV